MTTKFPFLRRAALLPAALVLLAACGGSQQYYRLSADGSAPVRAAGLSVGIGPVALPGYLDRAALVYQSGPNTFQIPLNAQWTGTLQDNIAQALRNDVGRRINSGNVVVFPWVPGTPVRYQVAIDVAQFQSVSGVNAILEVSWRIMNPADGHVISRHRGSYQESIAGDGYDPVVKAESALVAQLADGIVQSLPRR